MPLPSPRNPPRGADACAGDNATRAAESGSTWARQMLEFAIRNIETADYLTDSQKRDILYNNAARFLRLSDDVIASHHGR